SDAAQVSQPWQQAKTRTAKVDERIAAQRSYVTARRNGYYLLVRPPRRFGPGNLLSDASDAPRPATFFSLPPRRYTLPDMKRPVAILLGFAALATAAVAVAEAEEALLKRY